MTPSWKKVTEADAKKREREIEKTPIIVDT
jgi:hypothetical protein